MTGMKVVDMHCDTISRLWEEKRGSLRENPFQLSLKKMRQGDYLLQNFALFVHIGHTEDPWGQLQELYQVYLRELEANRERIAPVLTFSDIEKNRREGRLSALLTVEEGAVCGGSLEKLRRLYEMGVRMMTLTWNYPNELGAPNLKSSTPVKARADGDRAEAGKAEGTDTAGTAGAGREADEELPWWRIPDTRNGLTETGIAFVEEMQRLGMIVDVSHLSDAGFYDVCAHTRKPFAASHSNARAVCPWVRNLTDDMIRRLGERGGITGLNFCADFLTEVPAGTYNPGSLEAVVRHAKHITKVGGMEVLGLGSDFDGIEPNEALPTAAYLPRLAEALHDGGFTWDQTERILSGNVLRFYRDLL